jgi:hypothetical protein
MRRTLIAIVLVVFAAQWVLTEDFSGLLSKETIRLQRNVIWEKAPRSVIEISVTTCVYLVNSFLGQQRRQVLSFSQGRKMLKAVRSSESKFSRFAFEVRPVLDRTSVEQPFRFAGPFDHGAA